MDDTTSLYTRACNIVDMIVDRWRGNHENVIDEELTSLAYAELTRQVANDLRKTEMYQANLAFVHKLASDDSDIALDIDSTMPGDLSDLFDVFDDEPEEG